MALSAKDKQDMAEMIAAAVAASQVTEDTTEADEVTKRVLADAPRGKTQSRAADTTKKAQGIKRTLDPIAFETGDDSLAFEVCAQTKKGIILRRGARVYHDVDGKRQMGSLTVGVLRALREDGVLDGLIDAIETVDKRAKLGTYAPAPIADAS